MAYLLFSKNTQPSHSTLHTMIETEALLNESKIIQNDYIIKIISQNDFNSLKNETKHISSVVGDVVNFENNSITTIESKESFDSHINFLKEELSTYVSNKNVKESFKNLANTFKTTLNTIDSNTITFPLNQNLYQYLDSQSLPYCNPLQLI